MSVKVLNFVALLSVELLIIADCAGLKRKAVTVSTGIKKRTSLGSLLVAFGAELKLRYPGGLSGWHIGSAGHDPETPVLP